MVRWYSYGVTNIGRVRRNNEDAYATFNLNINTYDRRKTLKALVVADGMGGHNAGEVASDIAVNEFILHVVSRFEKLKSKEDVESELTEILNIINEDIKKKAAEKKEYENMGTTIVAYILSEAGNLMLNVGDSRGYLFRDGKLKRVTRDHSYVQQLIDSGIIDEEEAREHPQKNIILQALGVSDSISPSIYWIDPDYGDIVLLCSDGLTDMVEDKKIEEIMNKFKADGLRKIGDELIKAALNAGGKDNITVVLGMISR